MAHIYYPLSIQNSIMFAWNKSQQAKACAPANRRELANDFFDHVCREYSGQLEVQTLRFDAEAFVIQTQLMQQGCMNVADMGRIANRPESEFVRFAMSNAWLKSTPCEPHGERIDMMIASR